MTFRAGFVQQPSLVSSRWLGEERLVCNSSAFARDRFSVIAWRSCASSEVRPLPRDTQFCSKCAAPLKFSVPDGDERERLVCTSSACGLVTYKNPKITVASVTITPDRQRILLARRKINPEMGKWNIIGGQYQTVVYVCNFICI